MAEKDWVYDYPIIKTQTFKVYVDGKPPIYVERKEVIRQQHNMGCTDGMKEGEVERRVSYDVWIDVDQITRNKATEMVEVMVEKEESQ